MKKALEFFASIFLLFNVPAIAQTPSYSNFVSYYNSGTFFPPAGSGIAVEMVGGGGGCYDNSSDQSSDKSGGGGGAYAYHSNFPIVQDWYDVIVGLGGSRGNGGSDSKFILVSNTGNFIQAGGGGAGASLGSLQYYGGINKGQPNGLYTTAYYGGNGGTSYSEVYALTPGGGGGGQAGSSTSNGANGTQNSMFGAPGNGGGPAGYPGSGGDGGGGGDDGENGFFPGGGAGGDGFNAPRNSNTAKGADGYVRIFYNNVTYSLLTVSVPANNCLNDLIPVNLNGTASGLPIGRYRVTYSISGGANNLTNATTFIDVTQAGEGSFSLYLANSGSNNVITIHKLESGTSSATNYLCSTTLSGNNISNTFTTSSGVGNLTINQALTTGCAGDSMTLFVQNASQGNYIHMDGDLGSNMYVQDNTMVLTPSAGFTIEGWFSRDALGSYGMASQCVGSVPAPFDVHVSTNGSVVFRVGNGTSFLSASTANNIISNAGWFHIACVYDPAGTGSLKIYVNKQLRAALNTVSSNLVANAAGSLFRMGNRADLAMPLRGNLDEIRIWNTVRTATEIANNSGIVIPSNSAGLVGYYKYDEGGGSTTRNSVTNNLTGQMVYSVPAFQMYFVNSGAPVGIPYSTYLWSPHGQNTSQINATTTGTYTVTVSNSAGCTGSTSAYVTVNPSPAPEILANGPTSFCQGGSVQLSTLSADLYFDGANDYVEDNSLNIVPTGAFTIEGWMSLSDIMNNPANGLASRALNNIAAPFDCYSDGTRFKFFVGNGTTWNNIQTPVNTIFGGNYFHVACVYNPVAANNMSIYINGELKASGNSSVIPGNISGSKFRIGNRFDNGTATQGRIDEVRIWNAARTQNEIIASMNTSVPNNSANLVGYYKLNEGSGTTTKNSVTGASSGILTNGPIWWAASGSPLGFGTYAWSPGGATTSAFTVSNAGVYTVTATNSYGCTGTSTKTITVFDNSPEIVADGPTTFCDGDSVTLSTSQTFATYNWTPGNVTTPTLKVLAGGAYVVSCTDLNGCGGTNLKDTQRVIVSPRPMTTVAATPSQVCTGASTNLSATLSYPSTYLSPVSDSIIIPQNANANPFPRTVDVTNLPTSNMVLKNVYLNNVKHSISEDLDIWLQSPSGQNIILMSDAGGGWGITNSSFIFTDSAGAPNLTTAQITGTTFKPTNLAGNVAPEPTGTLTQLSAFTGDLNGTWKLFVRDDAIFGGAALQYITSFQLRFETITPASGSWTCSPINAAAGIQSTTSLNTLAVINENATYTFSSTMSGCSGNGKLTVKSKPNPVPVINTTGPLTLCTGDSVTLTTPQLETTCLNFTTIGQHVAIPYHSSLDPTTSLSLEAWIRPSNLSGVKYIIARGNNDLSTGFYGLYMVNDKLRFSVAGNPSSMASDVSLPVNVWTHVAGTWDGTTMRLYINGILEKSKNQIGPKSASTANLRIGWLGAANPYQYQFIGMIDEVRVWNQQRTQEELVAHMNSPLPASNNGLIAYFKLNEGTGSTSVNSVAGMSNGTLTSSPAWVLNANPGYTGLTWSPGGAAVSSIVVNTSNTYSVTVTSANGCSATATQEVVIHPSPVANITAQSSTTFCNGDTIRLITNYGGNAIAFNGSNRLVGPNGVVPTTGDYTVEVWAKQNGILAPFANIFAQGRNLYLGKDNNGNIRLGDSWANTGVAFPADMNWHHYAVVRTSSNTHLYIDGVLMASKGGPIPSPGVNGIWPYNLNVGAQWGTNMSEGFNGFVDEMQIWNEARTIAQIQTDRLSVYSPSAPGLVAYYTFDEGSGTTALNKINNGDVLNFNNNPVWSIPSSSPLGGDTIANFSWSNGSTTYDTRVFQAGLLQVEVENIHGCRTTDSIQIITTPCNLNLNLKSFLQGYYLSGGNMISTLMNQGVGNTSSDCDTITVELHSSTTPFATMYSFSGVLPTHGIIPCIFPPAALGNSYYLVIKHRNSIETWSAAPVYLGLNTEYDFTTAANKVFGNNQYEAELGIYVLYTGDINQDGVVDGLDYNDWENDSNNFAGGYFTTDLNGDGIVDGLDFIFWEQNSNNFVGVVVP